MNDKEIVEYTVARTLFLVEMVLKVTNLIKEGWQPYGELFMGKDSYLYQAMVKYAP